MLAILTYRIDITHIYYQSNMLAVKFIYKIL